ncbi:LysR family transcriptional regulator [Winogradskya humida]|uniref:LysR family transcriptional regulator n=1 Tax=Winogradskya humida TaxID=113566 RepID=A0ABQ4A4U8_9ACTN|nr:LysR family transcriptional regulator [Actinoplanes humidus]GIE25749.1 LysR family transcriptional regulator [Actinoplanes humidus]
MPEIGPDLDLRLVRYFAVVAEHRNFSRAATALHLAQPSLSRQIQRLEERLGVRLIDRTPQGSTLTGAGQAFLPKAHALLEAARDATLTARAAAPPRTITVGYVEDLVVTPVVRELRRRFPGADVRTRHLSWNGTQALPDGGVDALLARLPLSIPAEKLRVTVLYEEPRVLVVPLSHPLAGKESVTLDDLADELVPCTSDASVWGTDDGRVDETHGYADKIELIAEGRAVAVLPIGDRRTSLRDDLATIPIEGIDPCQVVIATRAGDTSALTDAIHSLAGLLS